MTLRFGLLISTTARDYLLRGGAFTRDDDSYDGLRLLETTCNAPTGHYYEPLIWITSTDHYYEPMREKAYYDNNGNYDY